MPKHVYLTKYFRERSRFQSNFKINSLRNPLIHLRNYASAAGGGGGRPNRSGRPPTLPPYPEGLVIGVCGLGSPRIILINHIHDDELAAVAGAVFCGAPPVLEVLQERHPFYFREEFGNRFIEFKGEFFETLHYGYVHLPSGSAMRLMPTPSYCYVLRHDWLAEVLGSAMSYDYGYVDESARAYEILQEFRAKRLMPLYHWQSRLHMNMGPTITARDLPDGYLLDNRKRFSYKPNVIPKCVPSLLDVKENPELYRDNQYKRYL